LGKKAARGPCSMVSAAVEGAHQGGRRLRARKEIRQGKEAATRFFFIQHVGSEKNRIGAGRGGVDILMPGELSGA
jgi:hypothetical protein